MKTALIFTGSSPILIITSYLVIRRQKIPGEIKAKRD